jgi:5'-nucleotidase
VNRLVIGISSNALFDHAESGAVFRDQGVEAYRRYQEEHLDDPLAPGVAFPFIQRLLSLNDLAPPNDPLVEVLIPSHNSPDTGLRAMRSARHHGLDITRAIFTEGKSPYEYIPEFNISLFLSASRDDVRKAVALVCPAGHVLRSAYKKNGREELIWAFDVDGVLADDKSEQFFQEHGLQEYEKHEAANATTPLSPGVLARRHR